MPQSTIEACLDVMSKPPKRQEGSGLVVMSGGQDSTTCLGVAIMRHGRENVRAVAFDYGQKHSIELEQARLICERHEILLITVDIPVLKMMESSALVTHGDTSAPHEYLADLPATFVPARNALFLTMAFGLAMEARTTHIYTGVCQTDYSGYPDCREEFVVALENALQVGYQSTIKIVTPLMHLDKAATFELARRTGVWDDVIQFSHTCYEGVRDNLHPWGAGCGACPACELRAKGFNKFEARY